MVRASLLVVGLGWLLGGWVGWLLNGWVDGWVGIGWSIILDAEVISLLKQRPGCISSIVGPVLPLHQIIAPDCTTRTWPFHLKTMDPFPLSLFRPQTLLSPFFPLLNRCNNPANIRGHRAPI